MTISTNRRAYFDYQITKTYQAGIELFGFEVKAIKKGRVNLAGSYVLIRNNNAYVVNLDIPPYQPKNTPSSYNSKRNRKLLLKKKEIKEIAGYAKEHLTVLPLRIYTKRNLIKLEIGLGKIKKKIDKRELIKKREAEKEMRRKIKLGTQRI